MPPPNIPMYSNLRPHFRVRGYSFAGFAFPRDSGVGGMKAWNCDWIARRPEIVCPFLLRFAGIIEGLDRSAAVCMEWRDKICKDCALGRVESNELHWARVPRKSDAAIGSGIFEKKKDANYISMVVV